MVGKIMMNFRGTIGLAITFLMLGCGEKKQSNPSPNPHATTYTCPMHPNIRSDKPGNCPICGMELVPVFSSETSSTPIMPSQGSVTQPESQTKAFQISPQRLQEIGVTFAPVIRTNVTKKIQAPGIIAMDESTLRDINLKAAGGFVEKLYANYPGKLIRKGEPLMKVLSEGWIEAQIRYIKAYRSLKRGQLSADRNSFTFYNQVERFRQRLRVWDISEKQIQDLEKFSLQISEFDLRTGKGLRGDFEVLSPISGYVHEKKIVEGARFEAGQSLLILADLSHVWVTAEFPEDQASYLTLGQTMEISLPALPNQIFESVSEFVAPNFSEQTRRLKVRLVLFNPKNQLRPGMFANVTAVIDQKEKLVVPIDAVLPTGERFLVFIYHKSGHLEPRYVKMGEKFGDNYEVVEGLSQGELVVTSANFLIDSESRLQGALKAWSTESSMESHSH